MEQIFKELRKYRLLPQVINLSFLLIAFGGRLPQAMLPIGTLTLVSEVEDSVAAGGLAAAALAVGCGVGNPIVGLLCDKFGQKRITLGVGLLNFAGVVLLLVATWQHLPLAALCAISVFVGLTSVPVGPLARTRWFAAKHQEGTLGAALSYESTIDELTYVLGPALVGVFAASINAYAALVFAAILVILCVPGFALHSSVKLLEVTDAKSASGQVSPRFTSVVSTIWPLALGAICTGIFFGSTQTSITQAALSAGIAGQAGLIYAVLALGSTLTALLSVALPTSYKFSSRMMVGGLGMAILSVVNGLLSLHVWPWNIWPTLLLAGLFIGPHLVAMFNIAGMIISPQGLSTAMTILGASVVSGVAIGAAVAGHLATSYSTLAAFLLSTLAASGIVLAGAIVKIRRSDQTQSQIPAS